MSYEFIDNPGFGDLQIAVQGESLEEVFTDAAMGLSTSIVDPENVTVVKSKDISLEATNPEDLLYAWLEELLIIKDSDAFIAKEIELAIKKGKTYKLEATLSGEKINPNKHELKYDVKAVTMHGFSLKKKGKGWKANVVFDL